jgi:elongation factor G
LLDSAGRMIGVTTAIYSPNGASAGIGFAVPVDTVNDIVPRLLAGVEKGLKSVMNSGPLVGFPVIDFKVTLIDGAFHDVDSSVLAFEIASRAAFREASEKVQMKLLEPVMKVEVVSPEDYVGTVIGDLNSRRGMIQGQEMRGNATVINAMVPLANMFGYVNNLRSATQGRAQYTMQFDHYEAVPSAVAKEVIEKLSG